MSFDYTQEDVDELPDIITSYKKKIMFEKFLKDLFFALVEYNDNRKDLLFKKNPRDNHKIEFKYQVINDRELRYDTYLIEILIDGKSQHEMNIKLYDYSYILDVPFTVENLQKELIVYEDSLWFGLGTKSYIMNGALPSIRYFSTANKKFIKEFISNYNFGE